MNRINQRQAILLLPQALAFPSAALEGVRQKQRVTHNEKGDWWSGRPFRPQTSVNDSTCQHVTGKGNHERHLSGAYNRSLLCLLIKREKISSQYAYILYTGAAMFQPVCRKTF